MIKTAKKLIEVALPLEAINKASVRESYIYRGNPSAIHKWWAQRPLAAARAVLFAQMVDDPSAHPDLFPTKKAQEKERKRLFKLIEELVQWESTTDEKVLQAARDEIWSSWRQACAANADHPRAGELFDRFKLPAFHDPFAGGGTLPVEAQRLGLKSNASDLNPVAVVITKALIEIPPRFAGLPPVHPLSGRGDGLFEQGWQGTNGLAEDIRQYGKWIRDEAEKRIGHLYPKVEITQEMASERPDLMPMIGNKLTVLAWLWARTVKSPNPAFAHVDVPLASTFMLSTRKDKEAYVEPVVEGNRYRFLVRVGKPKNPHLVSSGTKLERANFVCVMSGTPIPGEYIKAEGKAGRIGTRLMAVVAEGASGRVYLSATTDMELLAQRVEPTWKPDIEISGTTQYVGVLPYGLDLFSEIFTPRQLVALTTFSDLIQEANHVFLAHARASGNFDDVGEPLASGGRGAKAYTEALMLYLTFSLSKTADYNCSLVPWYTKEDRPGHLFSKQAFPIIWDYTELNPLSNIGGSFFASSRIVADSLGGSPTSAIPGFVQQQDAVSLRLDTPSVISTDPPYYDNVPYADLSDFFYVWLRRSLRLIFPDLFATLAVPKAAELVAFAYRHPNRTAASSFFMNGMTNALKRLAEQAHPAFPVTIYYAFKQSEEESDIGTSSTGWESFLDAVIRAGFAITGTWPIRTERNSRSRGIRSNALATSVILVCRKRHVEAPTATRRELVNALKAELPAALVQLQQSNIAPVDLAQAAIGPGMAVFTRYAQALDAAGKPLSVREALALINQVLDETLAEQEGDFDPDTRWALAWFEQMGFAEGEYGVAETLSKAKNTSVQGMVEAGILQANRGKVRLLRPQELPLDWDPTTDKRLTAWEAVHQLVRTLEEGGETAAAMMVARLGSQADTARELAYRLYNLCERKKRAAEALSYNGLVQSWPEIVRLAETAVPRQERLI